MWFMSRKNLYNLYILCNWEQKLLSRTLWLWRNTTAKFKEQLTLNIRNFFATIIFVATLMMACLAKMSTSMQGWSIMHVCCIR